MVNTQNSQKPNPTVTTSGGEARSRTLQRIHPGHNLFIFRSENDIVVKNLAGFGVSLNFYKIAMNTLVLVAKGGNDPPTPKSISLYLTSSETT